MFFFYGEREDIYPDFTSFEPAKIISAFPGSFDDFLWGKIRASGAPLRILTKVSVAAPEGLTTMTVDEYLEYKKKIECPLCEADMPKKSVTIKPYQPSMGLAHSHSEGIEPLRQRKYIGGDPQFLELRQTPEMDAIRDPIPSVDIPLNS